MERESSSEGEAFHLDLCVVGGSDAVHRGRSAQPKVRCAASAKDLRRGRSTLSALLDAFARLRLSGTSGRRRSVSSWSAREQRFDRCSLSSRRASSDSSLHRCSPQFSQSTGYTSVAVRWPFAANPSCSARLSRKRIRAEASNSVPRCYLTAQASFRLGALTGGVGFSLDGPACIEVDGESGRAAKRSVEGQP